MKAQCRDSSFRPHGGTLNDKDYLMREPVRDRSQVVDNSVLPEADSMRGREWLLVSSYASLALLIRLSLRFEPAITYDGVFYARLGQNLVSGNFKEGLSTYWSPLYPLLIGLSSLVFPDLEFAGRFVSVLAGALLVIPVYLLIRSYYGRDAATVGALLIVFYPELIYYSTLVLTESTYTLLFVAGILTGRVALSSGKGKLFFLTGMIFGACYLVRPEAIGFIVLLVIITLSLIFFHDRIRYRKILLNVLTLSFGFILLSLPYLLFLQQETGRWTISEKLRANQATNWKRRWHTLIEGGQITLWDQLIAGARVEGTVADGVEPRPSPAVSDPSGFILSSIKGLYEEYLMFSQVIPPLLILLAGLGLFRTKWSRERAGKETYLLLFLISTLAGYAVLIQNVRFLIPLIPIVICWSARGVIEFENWLLESGAPIFRSRFLFLRNRRFLRSLIVGVIILTLLPSTVSFINRRKRIWDPKPVAAWIKRHSDSTPLIMSTSPAVAFYAGARIINLPYEEYPVVIEYAKRKEVDYIMVEEQDLADRPLLKFLLDEHGRHPGLRLVYENGDTPKHKVRVFELAESPQSD